MDNLQEYLQDVAADMEKTWPQYSALSAGITTHPIPYFGDVKHARVLTVGVNPSADEFNKNRHWPKDNEKMTAAQLQDRLQRYFDHDVAPPHEWFETWRLALAALEVTHQSGAAHIDLSPRATVSMLSATRSGDEQLFAAMLQKDAKWFFRLLTECSEVGLLIFAGCVPNGYIVNFMKRIAPQYGFKFEGPPTPRSGAGKIGFYHLSGPGVDVPAFFCSVSPSGKNKGLLTERIEEHKTQILELLDNQPTHLGV